MIYEGDLTSVAGVVFDLDGTFYCQQTLRRIMLQQMIKTLCFRPWRWREVTTILHFRKRRESMAGMSHPQIEQMQYDLVANELDISSEQLFSIVQHWMFEAPLPHLLKARYQGVVELIGMLKRKGIAMTVYSDYPTKMKMAALELPNLPEVCSTNSDVNSLKPHPKGLHVALDRLGIAPENALFIGDRHDRDGICAKQLGVPFVCVLDGGDPNLFFTDLLTQWQAT